MIHGLPQRVRVIRIANNSNDAPLRFAEYAYYASLFYALLAPILGLLVPLLNFGVLVVLAVYCSLYLGVRTKTVYAPMLFPLAYGISYIIIQLVFHDEAFGDCTRSIVPWMLILLIIQSLSLRQGFLHRFAFTMFVIGLTTLPYLQFSGSSSAGTARMSLDRAIALSNSNALGEWFGFICVYFAIAGLETNRNTVRVASWLVAAGCLYAVGLTVSRSALLGVAIAVIVALRRLLRRGFVPVLIIFILIWIAYISGLFGQAATFYAARGMENTGRLTVWPLAIERFLSSPFIGVGDSQIATYVSRGHAITPHNSFLGIALGGGVIPLAFFLGYWVRAVRGVFGANAIQRPHAPFRIPLIIYVFLSSMSSASSFMAPWAILALSLAIGFPRRLRAGQLCSVSQAHSSAGLRPPARLSREPGGV